MPSKYVDRAMSRRALPANLEELVERLNREIVTVVAEIRSLWNGFIGEIVAQSIGFTRTDAEGITVQGPSVSWGTGVPVAAPSGNRGLYVRMDGGANTTLYVWEGGAWAAK